uniref:Uncharacterized protein n=1 Tax=Arundo donax TaxID=35708 RepID=A0A0A9F7A6_ARUDO
MESGGIIATCTPQ